MTLSFRLSTRRFGELLVERGRITADQLQQAMKARTDPRERLGQTLIRLGLVDENELDEEETEDLVELTADGVIEEPRSELGRYLVRHWERLSLVEGESLVYWLRKLVFRSAWLDHRVKDGRLDVTWDEGASEFAYLEPGGERALLELAPTPSWHELQFRRA